MGTYSGLTGAALLLAFAPALASDPAWEPVSADQLDQARGGFTTPSGLQLSLGIDRLVSINGDVVARTSLQIADIRAISGDEALQAREALSASTLIQNGAGNFFNGDSVSGTFIQNSLNDQVIRSQTVISSTVNSASLMQDLNFNQSVRDAAIAAIPGL